MAQAAALAAAAPAALRSLVGANRWALAGIALAAAIMICLAAPGCREAVPRVTEEFIVIVVTEADLVADAIGDVVRDSREPDPEPEPEPKRPPDPRRPPMPDPKPDEEDRKCRYKSFIRSNFRENLACRTWENYPKGPTGDDAHHIYPWEFRDQFTSIFKNSHEIHDPENGVWWELRDHRYVRKTPYQNRWRGFLFSGSGQLPSAANTWAFGAQVMQEFSPIPRAGGPLHVSAVSRTRSDLSAR